MSEVVGITKQREGQISNRETVGGVERATLQSSHITEWLFTIHDNLKKRVLEAFLETAKIALKGRTKKFQYILPDNSKRIIEIDGDNFAEADYGVDNRQGTQELNSKLDTLAQAALQNQSLSFSAIMQLYSSASLAEKQRIIANNEQQMIQRQQEAQNQQAQLEQQKTQADLQMKQAELDQKREANQLDNETKILLAQIQIAGNDDGIPEQEYSQEAKDKLKEQIREFDAKLKFDRERLAFDKAKAQKDAELKLKQINKPKTTSSK